MMDIMEDSFSLLRKLSDKDFVTFCTHVEYDGYYGGFVISIKEKEVE